VQDRSDLLKAYLLEIGVIRIRGARRRRNNDDGSPAGGKVDWDSEYVQQVRALLNLICVRCCKERGGTGARDEWLWGGSSCSAAAGVRQGEGNGFGAREKEGWGC
jgi:hypothetical protein